MDGRTNNFGALRWIAALAVILDHAYSLQGAENGYQRLTGLGLGWSAVVVFFTLSGYLICRSALRREAAEFWLARLLRILPGLMVCTAVTGLALGTVSSLPLAEYYGAPQTLRFIFGTGTLASTEYALPGVFGDHRITVANGSLWTLRYELLCYLLIFCLCEAARLGRSNLGRILLACIALCALGRAGLSLPERVPAAAANVLELFLPFAIGAWFAASGARPPSRLAVLAAVGAAALLAPTALRIPAAAAAIAVATIALAFCGSPILRAVSRLPDYSYGVYIYAFPIQQLVLSASPQAHPLAQALAAAILVLIPAGLSWYVVEKPAMALKTGRWGPAAGRAQPSG